MQFYLVQQVKKQKNIKLFTFLKVFAENKSVYTLMTLGGLRIQIVTTFIHLIGVVGANYTKTTLTAERRKSKDKFHVDTSNSFGIRGQNLHLKKKSNSFIQQLPTIYVRQKVCALDTQLDKLFNCMVSMVSCICI